MAKREYIGARYVPLFMGEWDNTVTYEPLSIVLHEGNSYTSRQYVPLGIDITNEIYWALTGNYNAQMEEYRQEVLTFDNRITANADDIAAIENTIGNGFSSLNTVTDVVTELQGTVTPYTSSNTIENAIDGISNTITELQGTVTPYTSSNTVANGINTAIERITEFNYLGIIGDGFSTNTYSDWVSKCVTRCGFNGVINKAQNLQGFIYGNNVFETQFNSLLNDANFDKVTHIIIYGGVNDYVNGYTNPDDFLTTWDNIIEAWKSLPIPRPRLYVCFGNAYTAPTATLNGYHQFVCECNRRLRNKAIPTIENVDQWLLCERTNVNYGDDIHPNNFGSVLISGYMEQILFGTYEGVHKCNHVNISKVNGDPADGYVEWTLNNGIIGFYTRLTSTVDGFSSSTALVRLYQPSSLHMTIGKSENITSVIDCIHSPYPLKPRTDGTNYAYFEPICYLVDNSIAVRIFGSGSTAQNYALVGDYTINGCIGFGTCPVH